MTPVIEMRHIGKVFPPNVVALEDVSIAFEEGEIHAVVGENGAGKSTLMKVLFGSEQASRGEILYHGQPANFRSTRDAMAGAQGEATAPGGIGMVHQEILLIPEYTVWENVVLGVEPVVAQGWRGRLLGQLDTQAARARVQAKISEFGFNLDPDALVGDISVAARQKVEILKLLYRDVSVLILDEPTAVLTPQEVPQLFNELRRLRDKGKTILFISHHLDEVLALSGKVSVLRKGRMIGTVDAATTSQAELARMMVGREVIFEQHKVPVQPGEIVLAVRGLSVLDENRKERLRNVTMHVRAGEIVGVAGVEGNGQFELVNVIMGLLKASQGEIVIAQHNVAHQSILERREWLAYVPQDRGRQGGSLNASITENAIMTHHRLNPDLVRASGWVLDWSRARQFAQALRQRFGVVMDTPSDPLRALSGGNQQKVILGREMSLDRPLLLLDQPTRGLDVGSMEAVHDEILKMRAAGKAILLISADLSELLELSDRVVVLNRGEVVADVPTAETDREQVGQWMLEGRDVAGG